MATCPRTNQDCPYWTENNYTKPYCSLKEIYHESCPNPSAYRFVNIASYNSKKQTDND